MMEPEPPFLTLRIRAGRRRTSLSGHHDDLSPITTQAIGALLDAAGVRQGTRVPGCRHGRGLCQGASSYERDGVIERPSWRSAPRPSRCRSPRSYTALKTDVVNGQENPLATILASKFYEVQGHM